MFKSIQSALVNAVVTPIKGFKKAYLPLLLIYFAYGAQGFVTIAMTFWEKENLTLSTDQLLMISVWVAMPWTMKVLVGPFVDSVKILGSRRKSYIFIGAALVALQFIILACMSSGHPFLLSLGSEYQLYLAAAILGAVGFMIQDVTADAMSTEVVERKGRTESEIREELAMVQVLGRLSLYFALMAVAGLSGWVAGQYDFSTVMWMALWIPALSVVGSCCLKLKQKTEPAERLDIGAVILAALYVGFSLFMAFQEFKHGQEIVFMISAMVLGALLMQVLSSQPKKTINAVLTLLFVIFIYRAMPNTGPGFTWWAIDELGFDENFLGILKQTGAIVGIAALWLMADWIVKQSIRKVFLFLTVVGTLLSLPELIIYNGWHELVGLGAKTVILIDTALESPLTNISMVPMLALIAFYAPAGSRATWFAVAASMMNLSLTASALGTKYLNQIYVVSREIKDESGEVTTVADYSQLGDLMMVKIILGFIIPLFCILYFLRNEK